MLMLGFSAQTEEKLRENLFDGAAGAKKSAQTVVRLAPVIGQGLHVQPALIAIRVIEALLRNSHLPQEYLQRRILVTQPPKNGHGLGQGRVGIEFLLAWHFRLPSL